MEYIQKRVLKDQKPVKRRHNGHNPYSNGFLSNLSRYKNHIALSLIAILGTAKGALSVADYVSKGYTKENPAAYSRSQPAQQMQTPESRLEQIAQENRIVIPKANLPAENPTQQPMQVEKETGAPAKEANPPAISIDALAGYIAQTYRGWTKKDMPQKVANDYSVWIIKYAGKYDIPVPLLTAAIAHESRFANTNGDLKVKGKTTSNYSEGICQIRKLTQMEIRRLMKKRGEKISQTIIDLKLDPELAIHMMAFYLDYLRGKNGNSIEEALGHYNGGPGYMNESYVNKVMAELKKAEAYFSAHKSAMVADRP